jgi:hypothetical protein
MDQSFYNLKYLILHDSEFVAIWTSTQELLCLIFILDFFSLTVVIGEAASIPLIVNHVASISNDNVAAKGRAKVLIAI